jgi:tetratricopeptide (TPR) repeat protein
MAYYRLKPQQALLLAQALYRKALLLKPDDFITHTALAQTWYYLTPFEPEKALADWKKAYELASDDSERQGILLHYARVAILSGKFDEAEKQLEEITYAKHQELKKNSSRTSMKGANSLRKKVPQILLLLPSQARIR